MTAKVNTRPRNLNDVLLFEQPQGISRKKVELKDEAKVLGAVVNDEGGLINPSSTSDIKKKAVGIVVDVDSWSQTIINFGSKFRKSGLVFKEGVTDAQIDTAISDLEEKHIKVI